MNPGSPIPSPFVPVVRYMIVCRGWRPDPAHPHLIDILGLMQNVHPPGDTPYPFRCPELSVFLALTDCRGGGEGWIVCEDESTGRPVFATPRRPISFGPDPLEVVGVPFRVRDCPFPHTGIYSIQFWDNGVRIDHRFLNLR